MNEWTIESGVVVTAENIDDIMCSALEGGITYWASAARVIGDYLGENASEQISRGGSLKIYDSEDGKWHELDREKLLTGIEKAYTDGFYSEYEWCDGSELDCCMVDAEVADAIVQCAIFGDVIYG